MSTRICAGNWEMLPIFIYAHASDLSWADENRGHFTLGFIIVIGTTIYGLLSIRNGSLTAAQLSQLTVPSSQNSEPQ